MIFLLEFYSKLLITIKKKKVLYQSNRVFDFLQGHHNNPHGFHALPIRQNKCKRLNLTIGS